MVIADIVSGTILLMSVLPSDIVFGLVRMGLVFCFFFFFLVCRQLVVLRRGLRWSCIEFLAAFLVWFGVAMVFLVMCLGQLCVCCCAPWRGSLGFSVSSSVPSLRRIQVFGVLLFELAAAFMVFG